MEAFRIGIDLGGTKTEVVLLDPTGSILLRDRVPTDRSGYPAIVDGIVALARSTLRSADGRPVTLGVGIPGMWDASGQRVLNANTTELIGRPLKKDLEEKLKRPVALHNDANCFAMAEALAGAGRGHGCVFGVILGTGCGGGLVLDGRLREGPHGIAGEWGHLSIDPNGPECYCGKRGCVETLISGSGVQKSFREATGRALSVEQISALAREGDPDCRAAMEQMLFHFGRALGGLISILDPDVVVLGGGLSNLPELYAEGTELVRRFAFHPRVRTPIVRNELGDSAGVIGAAWAGV